MYMALKHGATTTRLHLHPFLETLRVRPARKLYSSSGTSRAQVMTTRYITPDDLAAIIKSDKVPKKDYLVVDVRDDDRRGGHIKGSFNDPSYGFLDRVHHLVDETKEVPTVIFHCALSQARGPKAAKIYAETRDLLQKQGKDKAHAVLILQGGFSDFQAKFREDPELVEHWDKEVWGSD